MNIEWLEEQLSKSLDAIDARDTEINILKDIISELLPIDECENCILCRDVGPAAQMIDGPLIHEFGGLCFQDPHYDRARIVLGIEAESDE